MNRKGMMVVEAVFIGLAVTLSAISLSPQVRTSFQKNRAIEICQYNGGVHCEVVVDLMTKEEIFAFVKDDNGQGRDFYAPKATKKKGGGLRARILELQGRFRW